MLSSVEILGDDFYVEDLEPFCYGKASEDKLEDKFEVKGLKPFFYNEAKSKRWAAEEMERQRRNKEEKEQKDVEKERRAKAHKQVRDSIIEYNPKMDCKVFTRFFLRDFSVFDINEKCKYMSSSLTFYERHHINEECMYLCLPPRLFCFG
jgi:CDP-glycerol glycerophosphotransferase (TagB/SpsB family)